MMVLSSSFSAIGSIALVSAGKSPSRRAWPLLGGMDSRRRTFERPCAATCAAARATGSGAMAPERLACSVPVSVVLGVSFGLVRGVEPGDSPPAASASSPWNPPTALRVMFESSRLKPRPCIALSVCPWSSYSSPG